MNDNGESRQAAEERLQTNSRHTWRSLWHAFVQLRKGFEELELAPTNARRATLLVHRPKKISPFTNAAEHTGAEFEYDFSDSPLSASLDTAKAHSLSDSSSDSSPPSFASLKNDFGELFRTVEDCAKAALQFHPLRRQAINRRIRGVSDCEAEIIALKPHQRKRSPKNVYSGGPVSSPYVQIRIKWIRRASKPATNVRANLRAFESMSSMPRCASATTL